MKWSAYHIKIIFFYIMENLLKTALVILTEYCSFDFDKPEHSC